MCLATARPIHPPDPSRFIRHAIDEERSLLPSNNSRLLYDLHRNVIKWRCTATTLQHLSASHPPASFSPQRVHLALATGEQCKFNMSERDGGSPPASERVHIDIGKFDQFHGPEVPRAECRGRSSREVLVKISGSLTRPARLILVDGITKRFNRGTKLRALVKLQINYQRTLRVLRS